MSRTKFWIRQAVLTGLAGVLLSDRAVAQTGDAALDQIVAERFSQEALLLDTWATRATNGGADSSISFALRRQAAALYDLCRQLQPNDVRFARSYADTQLLLGDRERAIDALLVVRKLAPSDQVAMIQFVDLSANRLETAEAKVAYLQQIIESRGVAAEVKSHAAILLMDLYYARSEDGDARAALDNALKLNPQNIQGLRARYEIAIGSGDRKQRVTALANLLRAAPTDYELLTAMARECDAVGDYGNSGIFRTFSAVIANTRGRPATVDDAIDYIGTQLVGENLESSGQTIMGLLESLKEDGRIYTLALLLEQIEGKAVAEQAENVTMSRGVYLASLASVSQLLNQPENQERPTTSPAVPMPDVRADIAKLKASDPNNLSMAYAVALTEQLFFDLYFGAAEVDEASIAALGTLIGEEDPIIARLQGWKLLSAGKSEEAKVKFDAVSDRDGFARLGAIAVDLATGNEEKAREAMTQILRERPSGLYAAYVAVAAKRLGVSIEQSPAELEMVEIIDPVRKYASDVLDNPRSAYLLTAQPEVVSVVAGEPIYATVTLLNNGRDPITIGPGALIEPEFVIDVQLKSRVPQSFAGTARGKWTGAVRLLPQQKITQTIRVDQAAANEFLTQNPMDLFPLTAMVTTNPVAAKNKFKPGAAGQTTFMGRAMERKSTPVFTEAGREAVLQRLAQGSVRERVLTAGVLGTLIPRIREEVRRLNAGEADPSGLQLDDATKAATLANLQRGNEQFSTALTGQIAAETNPEVKVWMRTLNPVDLTSFDQLVELARSNTMTGQTVALIVSRGLNADQRRTVGQAVLDSTQNPSMREFANAVIEQPDLPRAPAPEEGAETPE